MSAVENGHKQFVKLLINAGADVNVKRAKDSFTVLQAAARHDSDTCVDLLIKAGADVNASFEGTNTALMEALRCGFQNSVDLLQKAGADVNAANLYGETPITMATKTKKGCVSLESLIKTGADVNISDPNGKTLLISAISKCIVRDAEFLINAGVNVNAVDTDNNTALIVATDQNVDHGVEGVKLFLVSRGVINVLNNRGRNALCSHIYKCADWNKPPDRTMVLLLYAAGETLDGLLFAAVPFDVLNCLDEMDISVADILQTEKLRRQAQQSKLRYLHYMMNYSENSQISLKKICREKIRK